MAICLLMRDQGVVHRQMRGIFSVALVAVASATCLAQSSLPVCPAKSSVVWVKCFGTVTFPDGKRYVGEWDNDQFNGQGMLTLPSGDKYVGEFKDDKYDGSGIYTRANGERIFGDWRRGNLIRSSDGKANQSDITRGVDAQVQSNKPSQAKRQGDEMAEPGREDTVARRLRIAAEQEKEPELRAALWTEYRDYMSFRQQDEREAEARRRQREEDQRKFQIQRQREQQAAAQEAERRRQAAVQEAQQRRAEEQERAYWACMAGTREPTFLAAAARCKAQVGGNSRRDSYEGTSSARPPAILKSQYRRGMNRICIYSRLESDEAYTIDLNEMCPKLIK